MGHRFKRGVDEMRLLLEFQLEENTISLEYRKFFLHFLKDSLSNANGGKYYNQFYNGTESKNFTFAIFLINRNFKKMRLFYSLIE